ncbi:MAG: hypothetical protein JWQ81_1275 [Amycolatopsis sp.]|uniref:hypothetical protein n=1 Tax=Amycolatopsis sp. TaxID=37632 RepID=UPI00262BBD92|nr:hypothetical protein [Amycolatopsis sp.]MCU1680536.1 hypothetical protein [Amycolatopsis sp.]
MNTIEVPAAVALLLLLDEETIQAEFDELMNAAWSARPPRGPRPQSRSHDPHHAAAPVRRRRCPGVPLVARQVSARERSPPRTRWPVTCLRKKVMPVRRINHPTNPPAALRSEQ